MDVVPQLHFRLSPTDEFELQLDEAVKTLRYGKKSVFFINLSRALFGNMTVTEMKEVMAAIVENDSEVLLKLFSDSFQRLSTGERLFGAPNEKVSEPEPKQQPKPAAKKMKKLAKLCD